MAVFPTGYAGPARLLRGGFGWRASPPTGKQNRPRAGGAVAANTIYRGCMGRLLLIVLAVIAAFMLLSIVISALHFIFWVALVALIVVVGMRLTGSARRRSRQ